MQRGNGLLWLQWIDIYSGMRWNWAMPKSNTCQAGKIDGSIWYQGRENDSNQPIPNTFYEGIYIQKGDTKYLEDELLTHKFFHQLLRSGWWESKCLSKDKCNSCSFLSVNVDFWVYLSWLGLCFQNPHFFGSLSQLFALSLIWPALPVISLCYLVLAVDL